jgi:hypothetical protein
MKKEQHHIVPRCMGGEDTFFNKIGLSPTAHAIISVYQSEYYQFCCLHRRQRKFLPKELLPLADKWFLKQAVYANSIHKAKLKTDKDYAKTVSENISKSLKTRYENAEDYFKLAEHTRSIQPLAVKAALSSDSAQKRIETFEKIKHQQGTKNSQYGTMWVTNGETNKKVAKESSIPEGYWKGRTL